MNLAGIPAEAWLVVAWLLREVYGFVNRRQESTYADARLSREACIRLQEQNTSQAEKLAQLEERLAKNIERTEKLSDYWRRRWEGLERKPASTPRMTTPAPGFEGGT